MTNLLPWTTRTNDTPRPSWPAPLPFLASTRKKSMRVKSLVCTTRWAMRWNQESWNDWTESAEVFFYVFFEVTDVWHHRWCLMFVPVAPENQWVWKSMRENITILSNGLLGILQASLQDVLYRQNNQKDPKRMTKNISARLANVSILNSQNDQYFWFVLGIQRHSNSTLLEEHDRLEQASRSPGLGASDISDSNLETHLEHFEKVISYPRFRKVPFQNFLPFLPPQRDFHPQKSRSRGLV